MPSEKTGRFQWPLPPWNADWQKWQQIFTTFAQGVDATAFALLEHQALLPYGALPGVTITDLGGGTYEFTQVAAVRFLSRTFQTTITVQPTALTLVPGAILCVALQSGAVGPQTVEWEQRVSQTPIDHDLVALGTVNPDHTITWCNGAVLPIGVTLPLFSHVGGPGDSKVKATAADTTPDYLSPKLAAGAGIALSVLNPGANEQVQVTATGAVAPSLVNGVGDPNLPPVVPAFAGQLYLDVAADGVGGQVKAFYVATRVSPVVWELMSAVPKAGAINPDTVVLGVPGQVYVQTGGVVYMCLGGTSWSVI